MTTPGPKTKESKGERRYVKRAITLSPNADDYVLSQLLGNEAYSNVINRIVLEHQALNPQPSPSAKYGLWDKSANKWLEYYYSDEEAATVHEEIGRAGAVSFSVCGVNGTSDEWLNEIEV